MHHLIPLRIRGQDGVIPISQSYTSIIAQFQDDHNPLVSAMHMGRIMVPWIRTECDPIKLERTHGYRLRQIGMRLPSFYTAPSA